MSRISGRSVGLVLAFPLAAIATSAAAQDEITLPPIVVSASQVPVAASKTGSAVTVVTGEEMQARGDQTVADALRHVPGVAVSQSGSRGTVTQVRLRGGESNQTLVLIDGIEVNTLGNGFFDFADMLTQGIERIEVLRGPQSGIYGSAAHTGVISIITKSGRGLTSARGDATVQAGSFGTYGGGASISGGNGTVYGALNAEGYRSSGFNISHFGDEKDGSSADVESAKIGADLTPDFNIEGFVRHTKRRAESDPTSFTTGLLVDGSDDVTDFESTIGSLTATHKSFGGHWTNTSAASFYDTDIAFDGESGPYDSTERRYDFSHKSTVTLGTDLFGGETHTLTGLVEHREEEFKYRSPYATADAAEGIDRDRTGLAGEYLLDLPSGTTLSGALRHDWNDGFKDATTWRASISQKLFEATRLHGSIGTGITDPTFIEQYGVFGNFVGNPDLKPEHSTGWDAGIEQGFLDNRLTVDVTYFRSRLHDEIATVYLATGQSTIDNLDGTTHRQGVEISATAHPTDWLDLTATYTYTDARNPEGEESLRRPKHAASFDATARFDEGRGRVSLGVAYNGNQKDTFFGPAGSEVVTLDNYTLVSAKVSYDLTREMTVFALAQNIFDEDYEEIYSYRAPGFAAYGGVRVRFGADAPASPAP